jgi:hypothetical protein
MSFEQYQIYSIVVSFTTYAATVSDDCVTDCVLSAAGMSADDAMKAYIE